MSAQTLTVALPDPLYARLQRRASQANRTVEAELLDVLAASVPEDEQLPPDLAASVAALDLLDDAALRRAADTRMAPEALARLESVHLKRQRDGLSEAEEAERRELLGQYDRALIVRAQALAAMHRRGLSLPDPPGP
jgi:plasmid stability protein